MTDDYTTAELMVCVLARQFPDGAWAATGANSQIATAAMQLARLTTAPNLTLMIGGGGSHNTRHPLLSSSADGRYAQRAESVFSIEDVVNWESGGHRKRHLIACFGGLQIDRYGNANMIGIGPDYPRLRVRGPGTVGLYFSTRFHRVYLVGAHHTPQVFCERVDYVSSPGRTAERRAHCAPHSEGPVSCVTPLCSFGFDESGEMIVQSVHPGVTAATVRRNTGWEVRFADSVTETTPPTARELELLRTVVDPSSVLSRISLTEPDVPQRTIEVTVTAGDDMNDPTPTTVPTG
jgi:glutaconate CoA-transferase subunit B